MKNTFFLVFVCMLLFSCSSKLHVVSVGDKNIQVQKTGLTYFLPRAVIEIQTEVTSERFIPGPYHKYAEKFLSIKDVMTQKTSYSDITGIKIQEYYEADPSAAFLIMNNKNNDFYFDDNMVLLGMNTEALEFSPYDYHTKYNIPDFYDTKVHFTDMTVEENFTSIFDTTYKVIEIDSVFQKIPVYNPVMTIKSEEQKAEEAAEFILELRKSRLYLLQGDIELFPENKTMKQILNKLDEMEQKYLELFIGKTIKESETFVYRYIPDNMQQNDSATMFYLCDNLGVTNKPDNFTYPVYLKFKNTGTANEFDRFFVMQNEIKEKTKGLHYRIPSTATVYVGIFDNYYAQKNVIVPQCGIITSIPEKIMNKKDLIIKIHPQYGSILRIK